MAAGHRILHLVIAPGIVIAVTRAWAPRSGNRNQIAGDKITSGTNSARAVKKIQAW